jgi:aminoglycoside phosphotransferase (APT) family kinase protein
MSRRARQVRAPRSRAYLTAIRPTSCLCGAVRASTGRPVATARHALAAPVSRELTEPRARTLLEQASTVAGLSSDGARLLRIGSNAVYHLTARVVARVSRGSVDVDRSRRTVAVARWLESVDYPAVRAIDVDQPVVIDGHAITFWQSVSDDGQQYATVAEVAEVLARLHRLAAPARLHLPELVPFENAAQRIAASGWLNSADRKFLTELLTALQNEYASLDFVLRPGVIHGDAGIGNVLHDYDDKPVVIDLDGFAIGPREWDLALTAIYYDSFGWHTRQEYETFVDVYGFDIMRWPGYPVMRAVREFLMVTWVIQKAGESERVAAEAGKRIAALRTGTSRKDWEPY